MPKRIEKWAKELKGQGTKLYIVSNSNDKEKVKKFLKIRKYTIYIFCNETIKKGLKIAQNQLNEKPENIAVVGDQIFTDVIGGNLMQMYTILVDAIEEKKIIGIQHGKDQ